MQATGKVRESGSVGPRCQSWAGAASTRAAALFSTPHVPDVLVKSRKREARRKKRVNNLFEGSCNLNDPFKILKSASKNVREGGQQLKRFVIGVTVEILPI